MNTEKVLHYIGFSGFLIFFLLFTSALPQYVNYIKIELPENQIKTADVLWMLGTIGDFILAILAIVFYEKNSKKADKRLSLFLTLVFGISYILTDLNEGYITDPLNIIHVVLFYFYAASATIIYKNLKPKIKSGFFSSKNSKDIQMGFNLTGTLLGFTVIFYYIGTKYFNVVMSSYYIEFAFIPFLVPILYGILGAFREEVQFRVFNILYIKKLSGSLLIGILVSSFLWALIHVGTGVYPVYAKFIEIFIAGIIYSLFFIRYGIITNIIGHIMYNIIIFSTVIFFSGYVISGIMVLLAVLGYYTFIKIRCK